MQSLYGMAHYDFNQAGAYGYEQALSVVRRLGLHMKDVEQLYRHGVQHSRPQSGRSRKEHRIPHGPKRNWSLAPAFDVTYSYNLSGTWTAIHPMTLNGKCDGFTLNDFKACAKGASMKRGRAETILEEVRSVVPLWKQYADEAGVFPAQSDQIQKALRAQHNQ